MRTHFDICKNYFFILPSIQIITSDMHPYPTGFTWGMSVDWLCFHLSVSFKGNK